MCKLIINQFRQSKLQFNILGRLLKVIRIYHLRKIIHKTDVAVTISKYKIGYEFSYILKNMHETNVN